MKESVNLLWNDKMSFETEIDGHKIVIDATPSVGGQSKGPRPKPFMLLALAGCTAMDVISILKKMRIEVKDFSVTVDGDLTEKPPKHFYKMHVIYKIFGDNIPVDKVKRAIKLSEENYCGVSASYKKAMELSSEIQINGEPIS